MATGIRTLLTFAFTAICAQSQWLNHPDPTTPRTKDGRPNLAAPAPRMNNRADLSGVWRAEPTPLSEWNRAAGEDIVRVQVDIEDVSKYGFNVFWDVKPGEEPTRPETGAFLEQRLKRGEHWQPTFCLPESVPAGMFVLAFKMIQAPREIVVLFDNINPRRQIYLDGRALPRDPLPTWMGYSAGKWEGDTLVVETVGITERAWLDALGHPHSDEMRMTERFRRRDFGHMDLEVTIDDPKYYTRPFSFKTGLNLIPDSDVLEYVCPENEKDRAHLVP